METPRDFLFAQFESLKLSVKRSHYIPRLEELSKRCSKLCSEVSCSFNDCKIEKKDFDHLMAKIARLQSMISKRINSLRTHIQKANEKYTFPRSKPGKANEYKDAPSDANRLPITTSKSLYTYRGGHPRQ